MVDKITQLRKWMASEKLDAYLVPHADRFQSEYLPPEDERLAWLTEFTGSHGMAAVLSDKAALFVSGIYTLQASLQIDTSAIDVVESPPAHPIEWLSQHLAKDAVIGFDPELFTVAQVAMWQRMAKQQQWLLLPITNNPIDMMWHDRPDAQIKPATPHSLEYAGEITQQKIERMLVEKSDKADYILTADPSLVCWLLNMRGDDVAHTPLVQSVSLLDKEGQVTLFTNPDKITADLIKAWGNHVAIEDLSNLYNTLEKITATIQIDPAQCPFAVKDYCEQKNIPLIEAADPALLLRACKNEIEITGSEKAHGLDAVAFLEFSEWLRSRDFAAEKITELDVVQRLREARQNTGHCLDESFSTIAGFGPNGAIIHYRADEKSNLQLKEGSLLLLDSGGQYRFGTTDITRVFPIGSPSSEMKKHYTAVLKGLIALSLARFPSGTIGAQLDTLARAPVWAVGLDYAHGTGHGVGSYLSVHEGPQRITKMNLSAQGGAALQEGMILSIEPGIYLEGQYGIRLENLVVVVKDPQPNDAKEMLAFKTLTKVPFEESMIEFDQLSQQEKQFLQQFQL